MYCNYTPLYTVMWVMCGRCAGSVRVNGMIMTGLPCGKAGHNHDNITLYSCDRGLVPLFPDANLPPTTMMPSAIAEPLFPSSGHEFVPVKTSIDCVSTGTEIVVPVRNFGPFLRTGTNQFSKSTYPDKQNRRNTVNPEIDMLSRFAHKTIDARIGATRIVPVREKRPFFQTGTMISVPVLTSID